ncbi:MAG: hypothetical protein IKD97_05365, partial [Firmicutes bacterium]|nr:hypothetical protein [Bacillota bacterium]
LVSLPQYPIQRGPSSVNLFYSLLERFTETDTQVGFIHLPITPDQAASRPEPQPFSLTVEQMAAAVEEAIKCIR